MTDPSSAPMLWIDATRPAAGWQLWGMSLTERLIREAGRRGVQQAIVVAAPDSTARQLRGDLYDLFDVDVRFVAPDVADASVLSDAASVLRLDGDVVHDDRVLDHLLQAGPGHSVSGADSIARHVMPGDLFDESADTTITPLQSLSHYVPSLRLTMVPFMERVQNPAHLRRVDHLMFHRTFKGVIDAVARYGYYHLVRMTTRWLSATTVSPNGLTLLSILGIWAAIPLFAVGQIGWGVASAWAGVLLDSIDGKLARLTVNLSDAMGALEHAAAMPGLGLWFVALGWWLTDGDLLTVSQTSVACWTLVGTFLLDKVLTGGFKSLFGYELFDARPLDSAFHLIAARRNVHLLIVTVGALVDAVDTAFLYMAVGMVLSLTFHAVRFLWIAVTGRDRDAPSA